LYGEDVTDLADRLEPAADDGLDDSRAETKGERTRRRLLGIAVERFGRRGFRSTSVSEIAREAGLTQAAAYAYFDGKDALFAAAVDADASALLDEAAAQLDGTPVSLLIPSIIVHLVAGLEEHPLARRVLAGQEPEALPRLAGLPAIDRFAAGLGEQLGRAQEAGEVRADVDVATITAGLEAMVVALLMSTVQTGLATERHQIGVVAAFDAMLRPPA
jgi:AcrR family transcriptional regulator